MAGIPLSSGFNASLQKPLDLRTVVSSTTERDNISDVKRYEGLEVYVVGDQKYRLEGGITNSDWTSVLSSIDKSDITQYSYTYSDLGLTAPEYTTPIAADAFTSTEVSNLQANQLADGSTPWTSNNYYDDSYAISAINNDGDHGSTASHNYFSGDYTDLANKPSIAYSSTIPADNFTSSEVNNLRSAKLDDGTTPWTSNNYYDNSHAINAINNDTDHGSTASHNYYTDSDVDAHLSGGTGIDYSSGTISIDNTVATETWVSNNFNNYSHPSHSGDNASVDTGALSGATVISDLNFNINSDTEGHVTDANATYSTRNLTLSNLGFTGDSNANYYTDSEARNAIENGDVDHVKFSNIEDVNDGEIGRDNSIGFLGSWGGNGTAVLWDAYNVNAGSGISISGGKGNESHPTISHSDTSSQGDINTSGSTIIDNIYIDGHGHVTSMGTRTLYVNNLSANGNVDIGSYEITAGDFILNSDITLKKDVERIQNEDIDNVDFIQFKFKESDRLRYGVSAQQLQEFYPNLVNKNSKGYLTVSYIDFLLSKISRLEQRVKKLEE